MKEGGKKKKKTAINLSTVNDKRLRHHQATAEKSWNIFIKRKIKRNGRVEDVGWTKTSDYRMKICPILSLFSTDKSYRKQKRRDEEKGFCWTGMLEGTHDFLPPLVGCRCSIMRYVCVMWIENDGLYAIRNVSIRRFGQRVNFPSMEL